MRKVLLGAVLLAVLLSGRVVATSPPNQGAAAAAAVTAGQQRTYYIAAEEVLWDYAPHDRNDIAGRPWKPEEQVFVQNGPTRIGHVYRKSLYRAYKTRPSGRGRPHPRRARPGSSRATTRSA